MAKQNTDQVVDPTEFNSKTLADLLHQRFCPAASHESEGGCPWYFTSWDSPKDQRQLYLKRAEKLLTLLNGDSALALKVIQAISSR